MSVHVPAELDRNRALGADWSRWLDRLPGLARELLEEWALTRDGEPMHGFCSLVLPVRTAEAEPAVLKLTFDGDDESEHEALVLQRVAGDGMVRLLRADPRRRALLLERLHTEDLTGLWDLEACEVVAGLYGRLHLPALPQLRTLTSYVDRWLARLEELRGEMPVPPRMVEQALHLGRSLVTDDASTAVVVHGDLHYENVLAADREPWLAIDPKPMNGDAHYEVPPLLWKPVGRAGRGPPGRSQTPVPHRRRRRGARREPGPRLDDRADGGRRVVDGGRRAGAAASADPVGAAPPHPVRGDRQGRPGLTGRPGRPGRPGGAVRPGSAPRTTAPTPPRRRRRRSGRSG